MTLLMAFPQFITAPSKWDILFKVFRHQPPSIIHFVESISTKEYRRFRYSNNMCRNVAKELTARKVSSMALAPADNPRRGFMSVLCESSAMYLSVCLCFSRVRFEPTPLKTLGINWTKTKNHDKRARLVLIDAFSLS